MVGSGESLNQKIIFRSTSPLLDENIDVDSLEYTHLKKTKIQEILPKISIEPNITLTGGDIEISNTEISVNLPLENGVQHVAHLHDIPDYFGREASEKFVFTPHISSFLTFSDQNTLKNFTAVSDIVANIFATSLPKNEYKLTLCRLDSYAFANTHDAIF